MIDATSVKREDRKPLVELARRFHVLPVAIVLDLPEKLCHARNRERPDREFGPHVVRNQTRELRRSLKGLQREGFRHVHVLSGPEEIEAVAIERTQLWNDRTRRGTGRSISSATSTAAATSSSSSSPSSATRRSRSATASSRTAGPSTRTPKGGGRSSSATSSIAGRGSSTRFGSCATWSRRGHAACVPGNHDMKLVRKLRGRDVQITHGLDRTLAEIDALPDDRRELAEKELSASSTGWSATTSSTRAGSLSPTPG